MIQIGMYHRLRVARLANPGAYLTDGDEDVLLPRKFVPEGIQPGDEMRVFVASDSDDRPIATLLRPKAAVGEFAVMRPTQITDVGAFMDWGLEKDLLVPFAEQVRRIEMDRRYLVRVVYDERSRRLYGSTKVSKFLNGDPHDLKIGQKVELTVADTSPEGIRVIIDNAWFGMIFPDEMQGRFTVGQKAEGYIKRIREDGGIAVMLSPGGYQGAVEVRPLILERLNQAGGFMALTDKSPPEEIRQKFGLSKGTFKKAIGMLYKSGEIDIEYHGIRIKKK